MSLTLMYITNDEEVALIAEKNGVNRIWIDLETLGKEERQKGMDTVKSKHSIEDIKKIKQLLSTAELMVRINPWNLNSPEEVNKVIDAGADIIMLPMWKTYKDVKQFIECVGGRVKTNLLLETKEAVDCLNQVLTIEELGEIHIGLNDLHLSYGLKFMFELLSNGKVESICNKLKKSKILYGFGGIAKIGEGKVPAEQILTEHYFLGSTRVILSRGFCNVANYSNLTDFEKDFKENMKKMREYEKKLIGYSRNDFEKNRVNLYEKINEIAMEMEQDV